MPTVSYFENERLTLDDAIELTAQSLNAYLPNYRHVAHAFSGGKDSTSELTVFLHLIARGLIPAPEHLYVLYANTRLELPMLYAAAQGNLEAARLRGCDIRIVEPPLDDRFFIRMLGRGYPPPHNGMRWCTGLLKGEPMNRALTEIRKVSGEKFLVLTGMRIGESVVRDQRIALACSKADGECGQGWFQSTTPAAVADVLAPLLHWRVCHIADWLSYFAPADGFPTLPVLEAYGAGIGDSEALKARTGCIRCPVAGHDTTLDRVVKTPQWSYLAPFQRLWDIYGELSKAKNRLRKNGERNKDGKLSARPNRGGPLVFEARLWGLAAIKKLQDEVNAAARVQGRPEVTLIDSDEEARILELIEAGTWPEKWSGDDLRGDALVDVVVADGVIQPVMFALENDL